MTKYRDSILLDFLKGYCRTKRFYSLDEISEGLKNSGQENSNLFNRRWLGRSLRRLKLVLEDFRSTKRYVLLDPKIILVRCNENEKIGTFC